MNFKKKPTVFRKVNLANQVRRINYYMSFEVVGGG